MQKRKQKKTASERLPSLADVAKYAGVSTATVSRCLSNKDKVTTKLKLRVDEAVKALGYTPNAAARALRSKRNNTIGVIVPTIDIASFASGVQSLQERLFKDDYTPLLATSNFDKAQELKHAEKLINRGIDALVLVGLDHDPALYELLERSQIPFVNTWAFDPQSPYPCIGFNNHAAMRSITDYVLDSGHTELTLIVGGHQQINDRSRERIAGFTAALEDRQLAANIVEAAYGISSGRDALRNLMALDIPPTAVLCASDILAIGALKECARQGIKVPEELTITGLDNLEISENYTPALTTINVPTQKMGELAADYLLGILNGETRPKHTELNTSLILRDTVASPA